LDRLVYVNANLRLLEKCRGPDGLGVLVWKPIQVNPDDISMEPGDINHLQPHTSEDDVYDFLREEVMFRQQNTRSMTRRRNMSQGVANVEEASTEPVQRGGHGDSTLAYSRRSRAQKGKARMNEVSSPHQSQENESSESEAAYSSSEDSTNVDGWFAKETGSSSSSSSNGGSED